MHINFRSVTIVCIRLRRWIFHHTAIWIQIFMNSFFFMSHTAKSLHILSCTDILASLSKRLLPPFFAIVLLWICVGVPRREEARLSAAAHAGRAGGGYHHVRRPAHRTELRRHSPQQQWGRAPLQEPEALHGHPQPLGSSGVVEDLPWWSTNGWVHYGKGMTFLITHSFNFENVWTSLL